jgi:glycine betaine/proline transport system substrate-binding protein
MTTRSRILSTLALGAASALALAGCASGNQTEGGSGDGGEKGTITLGYLPSWTDGLSSAYLLENRLTEMGYAVEMEELTEAGPLYAALAQGDVDIYPSAWTDMTHAAYLAQYEDSLEDLGTYYENGRSVISVPSYVDIDSIEDLAAQADRFGGKIYGIEPGAGLTALSEGMLTAYGLDASYELVTSSTPAMLAELDAAIAAQEDVVVTLWHPFWASNVYDVKDLDDPRGALGETEGMHYLATAGFADEHPEVADLLGGIELDDAQYGALENLVVNEYGDGREREAIEAWLEEYPDVVPSV